ncbi:unnamed protein product [Vicia faba]|uniref:Uncharacterized protein n=1 Tax=Vicia faba TaxID=3906 RepID=A0AAV0YZX8_VICFA|nr:unnamed protein product [Vicia faba]
MARPIEVVKDINESNDLWKIAVRCKHLWTMTSASKKEHIKMILVDFKVFYRSDRYEFVFVILVLVKLNEYVRLLYLYTIQVIVPPFLVSKFKEQLAVGCSYVMQNFKVSNNDFSFKSSNHSFKLVFCGSTSVKKAELLDIPMNYLNILHLDAIVEGKFQSNILVDILGGATEISQINVDNKKSKVVFSITDNRFEVQYGSIIVLLINASIKEAQGGFPLNIYNAWNGTKLLINDVTLDVVIKLRDSMQSELPLLSSSKILSLAEITTLQHETTCVIVATLEKFEAGQSGWYYDGCVGCTKSVSLQDGKLVCYSKHISPASVLRYKLEVLVVEDKYKAKFIFWDGDCVKLIGKSALQMKNELIEVGEDDHPLEFPYALDAILKQELAIREIFVRVKGSFSSEEPTSKLIPTDPSSQDESIFFTEPLSAGADYDPAIGNSTLTPSKRTLPDPVEDIESV